MKTLGTKVNDDICQKFQELSDNLDMTVSENLRRLVENSLVGSDSTIQNSHATKNDVITQYCQYARDSGIIHLLGCSSCQINLFDKHGYILIPQETWNKVKQYV